MPATIQGTEGTPLTNVVVVGFSNGPNTPGTPKGKASDFTATIDWGDGPVGNADVTAGQVVDLGNGNFQVLGSHTYAIAKMYTLTVTITDNGSNGTTVVGGVPIMIQDSGGQATQISSQATVIPVPNGPTVVSLQRFGFHAQPTLLVLTFSTPMDPARAQDLSNYRLVAVKPAQRFGRPGHMIALRSATYDPTRLTVTLVPAERLYLRHFFQLTVNGTSPGGVTDTEGRLLDGNHDGAPGGDFVGQIGPGSLAGPAIAFTDERVPAPVQGHTVQDRRPVRCGGRCPVGLGALSELIAPGNQAIVPDLHHERKRGISCFRLAGRVSWEFHDLGPLDSSAGRRSNMVKVAAFLCWSRWRPGRCCH